MALMHDFAIIDKSLVNNAGDFIKHDNPNKVAIHDDIISYIMDTLKWVIGFNPYQNSHVYGLCYHGVTCFDNQLITPFKQIIIHWRNLFTNAPNEFTLTGQWITTIGDNDNGEYEKISVNRDELLAQLNALIQYCVQIENDENLVLVHRGI